MAIDPRETRGAMTPRDGEWMSRRAEQHAGALEIHLPWHSNMPDEINVEARTSWRHAHFAATWHDGGDFYQKLSLRAREGSCEWVDIEYGESLLAAQISQDFPEASASLPQVSSRPEPPAIVVPNVAPATVATDAKNAISEPYVSEVKPGAPVSDSVHDTDGTEQTDERRNDEDHNNCGIALGRMGSRRMERERSASRHGR